MTKQREIKFRAWDIDEKEFVYLIIGHHSAIPTMVPSYTGNFDEWEQYTGLKDKNGKEIYEGDLVKDDIYGNGDVRFGDFSVNGQDYYSNSCEAGFYVQHKGDLDTKGISEDYEIIGNIYENPELIKK